MTNTKYKNQKGQSLVLLLVFVMVAISITAVATFVIATNSLATTTYSLGVITKSAAEAGAETALVKLVRDPGYTGETITVDDSEVTITVTGSVTLTISSIAVNGDYTKRVEVIAAYSNNVLTVSSWRDLN